LHRLLPFAATAENLQQNNLPQVEMKPALDDAAIAAWTEFHGALRGTAATSTAAAASVASGSCEFLRPNRSPR
jgi:hypothetical protein